MIVGAIKPWVCVIFVEQYIYYVTIACIGSVRYIEQWWYLMVDSFASKAIRDSILWTQKLLLRRIVFFPSLLFSALLYSSAIATEHKVNHKLNFGYILPLFHSLAALLFFVVIFLLYEFLHCLYLLIHTYTSVYVHVAIVCFIACADVRVCYYFAY